MYGLRHLLPSAQQTYACAFINAHPDQAFSKNEVNYLLSQGLGDVAQRLNHDAIMRLKHFKHYHNNICRVERNIVNGLFGLPKERSSTKCSEQITTNLCACADDKPLLLFP